MPASYTDLKLMYGQNYKQNIQMVKFKMNQVELNPGCWMMLYGQTPRAN